MNLRLRLGTACILALVLFLSIFRAQAADLCDGEAWCEAPALSCSVDDPGVRRTLAYSYDPTKNCVITIFASLISGSVSEREFAIQARDAKECLSKARAHEKNFAPDFIRSVRVSTQWRGGNGKKQSYGKGSGRGYRRK